MSNPTMKVAGGFLKSALLGSCALPMFAVAAPVLAQDGEVAFEEIMVTARKRSESLFETPTAVSAISGDMMEKRNVSNLDDIGKYVPNLNITRYGVGNPAHAAVFIRGIGLQDHIITTDPGVGVYLDGVYLGRQMGANLSLMNIERVEVLRGPQGTLYGRNTLGGAVNIITKKPGEEEEAEVSVRLGTRNRINGEAYFSTKIAENLGISLTGQYKSRGGVGEALLLADPQAEIGEEEEISGRFAAQFDASDSLSFLFTVDAVDGNGGQTPYTIEFTDPLDPTDIFNGDFPLLNPSLLPENPDDLNTTVPGLETVSHSGLGLSFTAEWQATENVTAKFLTSYRESEYTGGLDDDATALRLSEFPEEGDAEQFSMELQINATFDNVDFVGGIYRYEEEGTTASGPWVFSPFNTPGGLNTDGSPSFGDFGYFDLNQETESIALYGNVSVEITDDFSVGGGLRYSKDEKEANAWFPTFEFIPPAGGRKFLENEWDELTWDINAAYTVSELVNVYAQIQKGYQTGGYPPRPFGGPANFEASSATTAINYEFGIKGRTDDNTLTYMIAAFWTDYDRLNLPISDTSGVGFETALADQNKSRVRGFELETVLNLSDAFSMQTTLGYLDAEITEVLGQSGSTTTNIVVGDSPALTPEWTIAIAPIYTMAYGDGSMTISADISYRSAMFGQPVNNPNEELKSRTLVGFNAEYLSADEDWSLAFYGENIFNEVYDQGRLQQSGFVGVVRSNDRSEFGVTFTKRF